MYSDTYKIKIIDNFKDKNQTNVITNVIDYAKQLNKSKDEKNNNVKSKRRLNILDESCIKLMIDSLSEYQNVYNKYQYDLILKLYFDLLENLSDEKSMKVQNTAYKILICESFKKVFSTNNILKNIENVNPQNTSIEQINIIYPIDISKQFGCINVENFQLKLEDLIKYINTHKTNKEKLIIDYCTYFNLHHLINDSLIHKYINKQTDDVSLKILKNQINGLEKCQRTKDIILSLLRDKNQFKIGNECIKTFGFSLEEFPEAIEKAQFNALQHQYGEYKRNNIDEFKLFDLFSQNIHSLKSLFDFCYKKDYSLQMFHIFLYFKEQNKGLIKFEPIEFEKIQNFKTCYDNQLKNPYQDYLENHKYIFDQQDNYDEVRPQNNSKFQLNYVKQGIDQIIIDTMENQNVMFEKLKDKEFIGFDSEWSTNFISGKQTFIDVVQLSDGQTNYLLDMTQNKENLHITLWSQIRDFINSKDQMLVGQGIKSDLSLIIKAIKELKLGEVHTDKNDTLIDIETAAKLQMNYSGGLQGLGAMFDIHICKQEQIGNWARRPLRGTQIHYALLDAFLCLFLYYDMYQIDQRNQQLSNGFQELFKPIYDKIRVDYPLFNERLNTTVNSDTKLENPLSIKEQEIQNLENQSTCIKCGQIDNYSLSDIKFVCDKASEKIGRLLRGMGFDTEIVNNSDPKEFKNYANQDDKILIIRSKLIWDSSKFRANILHFRSNLTPEFSIKKIMSTFKITSEMQDGKFCTRCIYCNSTDIKLVDKDQARENNVPEKSLNNYSVFQICKCGKNQWEGEKFKEQNKSQNNLFE